MDQLTTLQHLEYLETGFEVSKILAQAGYGMEAPAFVITWGQVAEVLAHTLADYGLTPDRLDESLIIDLVKDAQKALENDDVLSWRDILRANATSNPGIMAFLEPPDMEDDEGPLTELYENATRLGDDEAYWPDGGASADFFDDF
jgi:hypothetical protein